MNIIIKKKLEILNLAKVKKIKVNLVMESKQITKVDQRKVVKNLMVN